MSDDDLPPLDSANLMAPGLIHEMRHPLMGIKAGLQLVELELGATVVGLDDWKMVTSQVARLEELFRSYQELMLPLAPAPLMFAPAEVLHRALELLAFRTRPLGDHFSAALDPSLRAHGTPGALLHATINLLANALDAVDGKPAARVELVLVGAGDRVEVRVRDNGVGIPAELRPRLFERYATSKPAGVGTGLGLNIARTMIVRSGGTVVHVEPPSSPWAVTEFMISLPSASTEQGR